MKSQVLDHGYVQFVEAWGKGSDSDNDGRSDYEIGIIEAARQSTQGSFRGWERDMKLLEFLYSNKHETPFEFAGMVIEVQAPIFVFREWHRHRTQSYNEMSARYSPLPDLYYVPTVGRVMANGGDNKQAQGLHPVERAEHADYFIKSLMDAYTFAEHEYQQALKDGVPKELARLVMPVGHYSRMRASANLRNWLGFLTLRMDEKAQWEIRQFANAVGVVIADKFPHVWSLFKGE
jgi:thymidylate synthase (FAD)